MRVLLTVMLCALLAVAAGAGVTHAPSGEGAHGHEERMAEAAEDCCHAMGAGHGQGCLVAIAEAAPGAIWRAQPRRAVHAAPVRAARHQHRPGGLLDPPRA